VLCHKEAEFPTEIQACVNDTKQIFNFFRSKKDNMFTLFKTAFASVLKAIKPVHLLVGIAASVSVFVLNIDQLYNNFYKPEITLVFLPSATAKVGERVTFSYQLPKHGYFSLWNSDGSSKIYRVLPKPSKDNQFSIKLDATTHIGKRILNPDTLGAKEEMIILWTKKNKPHPPKLEYQTEEAFRHYLTFHPYDWVEKKAKLQIQ
jgi:hypothetical protein